jgi:hypothetical protein
VVCVMRMAMLPLSTAMTHGWKGIEWNNPHLFSQPGAEVLERAGGEFGVWDFGIQPSLGRFPVLWCQPLPSSESRQSGSHGFLGLNPCNKQAALGCCWRGGRSGLGACGYAGIALAFFPQCSTRSSVLCPQSLQIKRTAWP